MNVSKQFLKRFSKNLNTKWVSTAPWSNQVDKIKENEKYDAIIVGGGHNGLVAAAYLSKSGLK